MKSFLVFLALVGVAVSQQADMKYFLYENEDGEVLIEDLTGTPDLRASASDITYHFYSASNPTAPVITTIDDVSPLRNTAFSVNKDTIFIIHGWKNTHESDVNSHIRENILRAHDVNIFVVDWSPVAGKGYLSAKGSVEKVGKWVGAYVDLLRQTFSLKMDKVEFVGHSLGAHVAGCAGAALKGQVDRIIGLDPAGPLFSEKKTDERLDPTDAKYVQVIHTSSLLGYTGPIGHSDYYPNGGRSQPKCSVDLTGSCAHSRAYYYFAESILNPKFFAWNCDSYSSYTGGKCNSHASSRMGEFHCDTSARGDYYLTTNSASPYAQG